MLTGAVSDAGEPHGARSARREAATLDAQRRPRLEALAVEAVQVKQLGVDSVLARGTENQGDGENGWRRTHGLGWTMSPSGRKGQKMVDLQGIEPWTS